MNSARDMSADDSSSATRLVFIFSQIFATSICSQASRGFFYFFEMYLLKLLRT